MLKIGIVFRKILSINDMGCAILGVKRNNIKIENSWSIHLDLAFFSTKF
jgi:hypothetical protein